METNQSPEILGNPLFQLAVKAEDAKTLLLAQIAAVLISTKKWIDMSEEERHLCVHYLVNKSESETDLRSRLTENCIDYVDINWKEVDPNDKKSLEVQMIFKALGGLVAKNGALVRVIILDGFE